MLFDEADEEDFEDSSLNLSFLPGSKEAEKMTVASGKVCNESSLHTGIFELLERILLEKPWSSERCYLTWKIKEMAENRLLFKLTPSLPQREFGSSPMWATPNAMDVLPPRFGETMEKNLYRGDHENPKARKRARSGNLREQVVHPQMWPTPAARDVKGVSGSGRQMRKGYPADTLPNAVNMFPTPSASMVTMQDMVQAKFAGSDPKRPKYGEASSGSLNPTWVEWMMGYPLGWTACGVVKNAKK